MAKPPSSKYKLNDDPPLHGFDEDGMRVSMLEIRYDHNGNDYDFYGRVGSVPLNESASLAQRTAEAPFELFFRNGKPVISGLDIHIKIRDTLVYVKLLQEEDKGFYWSRVFDAIQTKIWRKNLYGELRYTHNGIKWQQKEDYQISQGLCKLIRFKAKLVNPVEDPTHKFSFFVYLTNAQGVLEEYEIDPDIKNPSA